MERSPIRFVGNLRREAWVWEQSQPLTGADPIARAPFEEVSKMRPLVCCFAVDSYCGGAHDAIAC